MLTSSDCRWPVFFDRLFFNLWRFSETQIGDWLHLQFAQIWTIWAGEILHSAWFSWNRETNHHAHFLSVRLWYIDKSVLNNEQPQTGRSLLSHITLSDDNVTTFWAKLIKRFQKGSTNLLLRSIEQNETDPSTGPALQMFKNGI